VLDPGALRRKAISNQQSAIGNTMNIPVAIVDLVPHLPAPLFLRAGEAFLVWRIPQN
jgi:hypothetical protein